MPGWRKKEWELAKITGAQIAERFPKLKKGKYKGQLDGTFVIDYVAHSYRIFLSVYPRGVAFSWRVAGKDRKPVDKVELLQIDSRRPGYGKFLALGAFYCIENNMCKEVPDGDSFVRFQELWPPGLYFWARLFGFGKDWKEFVNFALEHGRVTFRTDLDSHERLEWRRFYKEGGGYFRHVILDNSDAKFEPEEIWKREFEHERDIFLVPSDEEHWARENWVLDLELPYGILMEKLDEVWG